MNNQPNHTPEENADLALAIAEQISGTAPTPLDRLTIARSVLMYFAPASELDHWRGRWPDLFVHLLKAIARAKGARNDR